MKPMIDNCVHCYFLFVHTTVTFSLFRVGDNQGGIFTRLATLEARGAMRASFGQMLYLPIIFFAYGILLGKKNTQIVYNVVFA